jgi:outer membrane protein TolC
MIPVFECFHACRRAARVEPTQPRSVCCAVLAAAAGLVLAGCAHYQDKPLTLESTALSLQSRTLADPTLKTILETNLNTPLAEWPLKQWNFDQLTLAALHFHPSLDVARAQLAVARGGIKVAGGRPNPTIGVRPEYSFNPDAGVSPWVAAIEFDVPIETAGKRGHRIAQAQQLSTAARLNIFAAAWQVRANLRTALLEFSAAQLRAEALRQQVVVQEKVVKALEQRANGGAISVYDLSTAIVEREKIRLDAGDAARATSEALAKIAAAIGVPASALQADMLALNWPVPDDVALVAEGLRREALLGRADVRAALAEYAASQAALQLEISRQYPDVHLGSGYQFDQGQNKWLFGLGFELPVLNQNKGPIAEAEAKRVAAAAKVEALQATIMGELDLALAAYGNVRAHRADLEVVLTAQRAQQERVEAQIRAGADDTLALLQAQYELAASEVLRSEADFKIQQALGALENVLQRPFTGLATADHGRTGPLLIDPKR